MTTSWLRLSEKLQMRKAKMVEQSHWAKRGGKFDSHLMSSIEELGFVLKIMETIEKEEAEHG